MSFVDVDGSRFDSTSGGPYTGIDADGNRFSFLPARKIYSRKASVLSYFRSADSWVDLFGGNTITYDTATVGYSTSSLSFAPISASQGVKKTLSTTVAIQSGAIIRLLVNIPASATDAGTANVQIKFSSDANATKSLLWTWGPNKLKAGGWNCLYVRAGEDGTQDYDGATWTAAGGEAWGNNFNYVHVVLNNLSGVTCKLDSLWIGQKDVPRVVFSFDGHDSSIINVIAPTLAAYGWKAGQFSDGNNVAANATTLRTLRDTWGWDLGGQGMNHTNYSSSPSALSGDIDSAAALFVANGIAAPTLFAYPSNAHTSATDTTLVTKGFSWRRSAGQSILGGVGFTGGIPNYSDGLFKAGYLQPLSTNYTTIKNQIDAVCTFGGICSLFTHNASSASGDMALGFDLSQWYQLLEYLALMQKQYGLQVIKPSECRTAMANQIWY